jgi:hypothetical protein
MPDMNETIPEGGKSKKLPGWYFLIFPAILIFVVSPLVILVTRENDIGGFGGPWGIPFVSLFWGTPLYLGAFYIAQTMLGNSKRAISGLLALGFWFIGFLFVVISAAGCLGGGCGGSRLVQIALASLYASYLLALYWLAHRVPR